MKDNLKIVLTAQNRWLTLDIGIRSRCQLFFVRSTKVINPSVVIYKKIFFIKKSKSCLLKRFELKFKIFFNILFRNILPDALSDEAGQANGGYSEDGTVFLRIKHFYFVHSKKSLYSEFGYF